jgi:uncharacterized protein involved in exopolysaccharide biosynthesis
MTLNKRDRSGGPTDDFTTDGRNGFPVGSVGASRATTGAARTTSARRGTWVTSPTMARRDPRIPAPAATPAGDTWQAGQGQPGWQDSGRELPDYFGFLRRQAWIVVLCVAVGAAAAFGLLSQTANTYTSHASVLVQPLATVSSTVVGSRTNGTINLDTEAQILKSTTVAAAAQKTLGTTESTVALLSRVSVTVPANTSVLTISCTGKAPTSAAACAQAFARAYLTNRAATAQADVTQQANSYKKQLATVQASLLAVTKRLQVETAASSAGIYDRSQKDLITSEIQDLNSNLNSLTGQVVIPGQIIAAANTPSARSGPSTQLYVISGIVVGLIVGLLLGMGREARRRGRDV